MGSRLPPETAVASRAAWGGIVHLAVHARPNVTRPDFAEVWLGGDSVSDASQAFEIRELELHDATVVLSACETGAGRLAEGEGPISLARAFLQAGAGVVLATLWPVREQSSELMTVFHERLDAGADPPRALQDAKLALLRRGTDPLDLAPFVLLGGGR
jgi:CHAT domain-containing protein